MSALGVPAERGIAQRLGGAFREDRRAMLGSVATTVGLQACLVVTGVLAARLLGVEDRGRFALLAIFPIILGNLTSLGVPLAVTYQVASGRHTPYAVVRAIRPLLLAQIGFLLAVHLLVLMLLAFPDAPQSMRTAGLITLVWAPAGLLQVYAEALLLGQERFRAFNLFRILGFALAGLLVGVAALTGQGTLVGMAVAWTATAVLCAVASLVVALRGVTGSAADAPAPRRELVSFGLRGLLGSSSPLETFRLDQAVVGLVISEAALGIYVVAIAFTNLPRYVAQSVGIVAYPRVAAQPDVQSGRRAVWRFALVGTVACAIVAGALELVAGWIVPLFFGQAFAAAVEPCRILLVGSFLFGVRRVLSDGARGIGRPGLGTAAEITTWVVLLPTLLLLAPLWGVDGVAVALTIAAAAGTAFVLAALIWTGLRLRGPAGVAA